MTTLFWFLWDFFLKPNIGEDVSSNLRNILSFRGIFWILDYPYWNEWPYKVWKVYISFLCFMLEIILLGEYEADREEKKEEEKEKKKENHEKDEKNQEKQPVNENKKGGK